jgi:hypothetical protein
MTPLRPAAAVPMLPTGGATGYHDRMRIFFAPGQRRGRS